MSAFFVGQEYVIGLAVIGAGFLIMLVGFIASLVAVVCATGTD
ncbi:hypothetical protein ABIF33_004857 [Bradyrhizobium elkanii]